MTDTTDDSDNNLRFLWRGDPTETFSDWTLEIVSDKVTEDGAGNLIAPVAKRTRNYPTTTPNGAAGEVTQTYHVHRGVLSYGPRKSEYFAKQFQHAQDGNCTEARSQTSRIEFNHIVAAGIPDLLDYLYSPGSDVKKITDTGALVTLNFLGNYFDIDSLMKETSTEINCRITPLNANEICLHAEAIINPSVVMLVADYVCFNLCSFHLDDEIVKCHGYDFWVMCCMLFDAVVRKQYSEHWSKIFLQLSKYHGDSLTFELFETMTSTKKLPSVSGDVAVPLLLLESKLNPIGESQEENSFQTRCSSALVQSWRKIPSMKDLSHLISSVPKNLVIKILLGCIEKANSELEVSESKVVEAARWKKGMCKRCIRVLDVNNVPKYRIVRGAGNAAVNGTYSRDKDFHFASRFSREGQYNGNNALFSIFRYNVFSRWYLSVIPNGCCPGTTSDIDFYSASAGAGQSDVPPVYGWVRAGEVIDPSPTIEILYNNSENNEA